MARKITYDITRFDGGMSDDIRVSDLSKCAYVSHFDIYQDPHKLVPMPGFVADHAISGDSTGLKAYDIRAFYYDSKQSDKIYAVGEKLAGGGSKLWEKASPTTTEWTATTNGEGTDDISNITMMFRPTIGADLYYVTTDTGVYLSAFDGSTVTDKYATLSASGTVALPFTMLENDSLSTSYDIYFNYPGSTGVETMNGDTFGSNSKSTQTFVYSLAAGGEYIGVFGSDTMPNSKLLLWDANSALVDRSVDFGLGRAVAVDYVANTWVGVVNEGLEDISSLGEQANGKYNLAAKVADGDQGTTVYQWRGKTDTNGKAYTVGGKYGDAMVFYARIPTDSTPTTYNEGIFAVGRTTSGSPLAVSKLLDTGGLGLVESVYTTGNHFFFAHGEDGSVARLDSFDGGTYDVDCEYHTLMFGHDTPYLKEFKGITVITEDLPAGGEVEVFYRKDEDDSWTTLGTSDTDGDEMHSFTRAAGVPIGRFREIQFKVLITGNVPIKGIYITLHETDELPYKH